MRRLHGDYALLFNRRHDRSGHLFQGRYDRALTMYERPDVIKGFALMGGLSLLLLIAIGIALGG